MPCPAFYVPVDSPEHALTIISLLADYDDFQYRNYIKPDYSSAAGLEVYEDGEWVTWYDDEGRDFDEWCMKDRCDLCGGTDAECTCDLEYT